MHNDLYQKIESNALTLQELSDAYVNIMPVEIKNQYSLNLIYIDALLLQFYNNNQDYFNRVHLLENDAEGNVTTSIKININNDGGKELSRSFASINRERNYSDTSLRYLTNKINLIESIVVS